jgi:hypothetical protein
MVSQVKAWPISGSGQSQDVRAIQDAGEGQGSDKDKDTGTDQETGSGSGDGSGEDSSTETDEELAPSPNVRRAFTRLQEKKLLTPGGGASAISGPASHSREGTASKKHRTT